MKSSLNVVRYSESVKVQNRSGDKRQLIARVRIDEVERVYSIHMHTHPDSV